MSRTLYIFFSLITLSGELGAIDPARVSIVLPTTKLCKQLKGFAEKDRERVKEVSKVGSDSSESQRLLMLAPWELTVGEIGIVILEQHLVPELRSTALAHDRICFAIQAILKELNRCELLSYRPHTVKTDSKEEKCNRNEGIDDSSDVRDGGKSSLPMNMASASKGAPSLMSENLRAHLSARQILDITEPFLVTNYTMRPLDPVQESPIYKPESSPVQWLGRWARKLGELTLNSDNISIENCFLEWTSLLFEFQSISLPLSPSSIISFNLHRNPPVYLSLYLYIYVSIYASMYLSMYIYLCIYVSIYLFI